MLDLLICILVFNIDKRLTIKLKCNVLHHSKAPTDSTESTQKGHYAYFPPLV